MSFGDRKVQNPFKPLVNKIPVGFRNRIFLILVIFVIWMLFFDKANVLTQFRLSKTVSRLHNDKIYYQNQIKEVEAQRLDMENNTEKFARERYFMKTNDEDVFVIDKVSK